LQKIGEDFGEKISIRDLADLCTMSEVNFRRVFNTATGRGPLEYLNQVRVAMSLAHLRRSDRSVSWIAASAGFPSVSSYNRQFREVTGTTPLRWRNQNQEQHD